MIDPTSVANLVLYSAQVTAVIAAGAVLPWLLRLQVPGVRYAYWRALGLLCLALPLVQPRLPQAAAAAGGNATVWFAEPMLGPLAESSRSIAARPGIPWSDVAIATVVLGIVARFVWLGTGLLRLRRLRRAGEAAPPGGGHDELRNSVGARAEIRYLTRLAHPVTFGVLKPVVLLPSTLRTRDPEIQRAVLAHELLHVRRRDWAWVLVEEVVRAAFWFHPAVWWLISRIQLAREEVVDELAVLVTGHRRVYVEALLAFADETPLAPAAAFARRRHLFRRMLLISREAAMSSKRIVASCAVMALIVTLGSWYAVGAFPLVGSDAQATLRETPGPLEQKAVPISPENPIPRRTNAAAPDYPAEARARNATGLVTLQVTLDELGRVAETRVTAIRVNGPGWTLSSSGAASRRIAEKLAFGHRDGTQTDGATVSKIKDAFIDSAIRALEQWRYDPPHQAPISFPVTISFAADSTTAQQAMPPPLPPAPPPGSGTQRSISWTADGTLRVGGGIKTPTKIRDVKPVYPPVARAAGVQGVVILDARVEPDGSVGDVRVLRSIPLLDQAAMDAVRQWQFTPTLLNGQAVPVTMTVTVAFTLPEADKQ